MKEKLNFLGILKKCFQLFVLELEFLILEQFGAAACSSLKGKGLGASLVAQTVKNLPAMWETWVRSLGWEDPLEKGMATHSSILAWKIPWTEEPGGLYGSWGHKESDMTE